MNRLRFEILEPRLCLATATWIGSASIDFDEPLNWNPNQVPDADDEVYFSGFAAAMFVHDAHTDRIVVKHGDANFNLAGSFYNALSSVPSEIGTVGQAKLLVYGSGTLNTDETVYVGSQADGEVTLMDPGTIWNHQTVVAIGDDGTGTVDVTAGSYFVSEGVEVAVNDAGSLTVDDATGIFDWLTVGNATNTGTFVTQNNGTVNVGELETGKSTIKILDFAVVSPKSSVGRGGEGCFWPGSIGAQVQRAGRWPAVRSRIVGQTSNGPFGVRRRGGPERPDSGFMRFVSAAQRTAEVGVD